MRIRTKKSKKPSWVAAWLIKRMFPDSGRFSVLGDMTETFYSLSEEKGVFVAKLWFWGQIVKALPYYISDVIYWRFSMLKNYLVIAVRNIKRNKGFTFINFTGLTVGLTCFLLILVFVKFELSYDRYHENTDSIYRIIVDTHEFYMGKDQVSVTQGPLAAALKEELPEVVNACRIRDNSVLIKHKEQLFSETIFYADSGIFDLFTFPMVSGSAKTAMKEPYSLLLTRNGAEKYFNDQNPLGQTLLIDNRAYQVTGILENIPENSHFKFDYLSPMSTYADIRGENRVNRWMNWNFYTYIQLREDTDLAQLEPKLTELLRRHNEKSTQTLRIQPLKDIHFYGKANFDIEPNADIRNIYLFSAIALFILFIACFNYMNLSTARASRRAKEVGMHKVIGATRRSLVRKFLTESFLFALAALFLSIGLIKLLLPAFSVLMRRELNFNLITQGDTLFILLGVVMFVGLASGLYPAVILSSFQPVSILKGDYKLTARGSFFFRNSLVSLQFVISIALIICSLTMYKQNRFLRDKDLGLVTDYTMSVYCSGDIYAIRREFENYPGILDLTLSDRIPVSVTGASSGEWEGKTEEEHLIVYQIDVDYNFFNFYGIELLAGRNFSKEMATDDETYILNEAAVRAIGWKDPLEKRFGFDKKNLGPVIGMVKDFHFAPLNLNIEPLAISLLASEKEERHYSGARGARFSLKVSPEDIPGTIAYVESTWKKFYPDRIFRYSFLDDTLDRMYRREQRLGTMFTYFTLLAIVIAGLGLFGMVLFTVEQRTKEIGIRKVLGASISDISFLLTKNFLRLVLIANLIAWPIGWFVMHKWLQDFAFKISLGPWIFILSTLLALLFATVTVSFQSVRAASSDPVESLRQE
jgi:putative ABC transport system permease protein